MIATPLPSDPNEQARWREQARRYRLLNGRWSDDAKDVQRQALGVIRADAHGPVDTMSNIFRLVSTELGIHYDDGVTVEREADGEHDEVSSEAMATVLLDAGHAPIMQRLVRDLIGVREMLVRVTPKEGPDGSATSVTLRPVYPHTVIAHGTPDAPDVPVCVEELRHRRMDGEEFWAWDVLDISNPDNPIYRVDRVEGTRRIDVSARVLGADYSGGDYPYRDASGTPLLPYVVYHASAWPEMWGYHENSGLVDGTYRSAIYWSLFGHVLRNAAWTQRVMIDCELATSEVAGTESTRNEVIADPATILMLRTSTDGTGVPSQQGGRIDSFEVPVDANAMYEAVSRYDSRVAAAAGIASADIERNQGDARSAYAIALTSDGRVRAARRYTEGIKRGDRALLSLVASLVGLPSDGWSVEYTAVPELMQISTVGTAAEKPAELADPASGSGDDTQEGVSNE